MVGGEIVDYGWDGAGRIGSTTIKVGRAVTVAAVPLPDIQPEPEVGEGWVRFTQTARAGAPASRSLGG